MTAKRFAKLARRPLDTVKPRVMALVDSIFIVAAATTLGAQLNSLVPFAFTGFTLDAAASIYSSVAAESRCAR